ncbi:MAG TPA: sensor histidine kinase [Acidimicrobiales bacterium]|nr:sensor histidine kinase [Acidimicrobiales bacterium]
MTRSMTDEPEDPGDAGRVQEHLDRLTARWGLLSDLSFSDLVLYIPHRATHEHPTLRTHAHPDATPLDRRWDYSTVGGDHLQFVVDAQIRPTTSQTLFQNDLVGRVFDAEDISLVHESWLTGQITMLNDDDSRLVREVHRECIPVRLHSEVIAVVERVWSPTVGRRTGGLERVYMRLFERLAEMVNAGIYPFLGDEEMIEDAPRVGDGVIVLDAEQRINFASPNAVNALHRVGIVSALLGSTLRELGVDSDTISESFANRLPATEEVERRTDAIILLHCIPLIDDQRVTGAALLIRDVTDLRRRDRLLLSKDAAIREVHHRVKNNLQTISSLLRLQSRRVEDLSARTALVEAERRIRAIALVHEILAREPSDQVSFDEIVPALVGLARDANVSESGVKITVGGDVGDVSADVATPLALVIAELLQNAAEHAFNRAVVKEPRIDLEFRSGRSQLHVTIHDNGSGIDEKFDINRTKSLGLSIVRDLVRTQLGGSISVSSKDGTLVTIDIPLRR